MKINNVNEKKQIILALLIMIFVMGGLVALCMWNGLIGIIVFVIFCIFLFGFPIISIIKESSVNSKKEIELYGQDQAPNFNTFDLEDFYAGEVGPNLDILKQSIEIISNGKIKIPNLVLENEEESMISYILEQLNETGYGAALDLKSETEDLVFNVNRIIDKKNLPIEKISMEQITIFDSAFVKNRRKDNIVSIDSDLNVVHDIIQKQGYQLIDINTGGDEYLLTIITKEDLIKLKELKERSK